MVKNIHGGGGHKKFARKHTISKPNNKLRVSEDEFEVYAVVTKMLGNGMFHCHCMDNVVRLGHIRGKFTGRGKRDNMVTGGSWVLIGLREWDADKTTNEKKLQHCDLLEVYSEADKEYLKNNVDENWITLIINDVTRAVDEDDDKGKYLNYDNEDDDGFNFVSEKQAERLKFMEEMKSETAEKISLKIKNSVQEEEYIDIADI